MYSAGVIIQIVLSSHRILANRLIDWNNVFCPRMVTLASTSYGGIILDDLLSRRIKFVLR